ncbi:hypothetical protein Ciccas_001072 [Cichlidogyrus casuarinus]|uniref:Protein-L-isoaspartate O-methyltransferase domain-containing protein 2 n=1 Tax=Cichlidogyrus casuarinus TaxID=1844966 RepID=A0ABD2QLC6_9PLAT
MDPSNSENKLKPDQERALRLVDRVSYVLIDKDQALCDCPYKNGHVHLSAPSIYLAALENLDLSPGKTFLNVGSGTGYFSTVVGLILGTSPANHGFEILKKCFQHSLECLDSFIFSDAIYERDFAKPNFFNENIFNLVPVEVLTDSVNDNSDSESDDMQNFDAIYNWFPDQILRDNGEYSHFEVTLNFPGQYTCPVNLIPYDRIYIGGEVSSKHQFRSLIKLLSPNQQSEPINASQDMDIVLKVGTDSPTEEQSEKKDIDSPTESIDQHTDGTVSADAELNEETNDETKWEFVPQQYFFRTEFEIYMREKAGLHPFITKQLVAQKLFN